MKIKDVARGPQVLHLPPKLVAWIDKLPRRGPYVFADAKGEGKIATGTLDKAFRDTLGMAGVHVPQGWRSSLRTLARDAADAEGRPLFSKDWIDAVADHSSGSAVTDRYIRAAAVAGGARVLAWWTEQLGAL